jgi:hypothetical protein
MSRDNSATVGLEDSTTLRETMLSSVGNSAAVPAAARMSPARATGTDGARARTVAPPARRTRGRGPSGAWAGFSVLTAKRAAATTAANAAGAIALIPGPVARTSSMKTAPLPGHP